MKDKDNPRFYVMALEDFRIGSLGEDSELTVETYMWYAAGHEDRMKTWQTDTSVNFGTGYTNTGKMIEIWNKNGEGEGSYEYGIQNDYDIWKHIQGEYLKGWYIPSKEEWAAFADYFSSKEENPLTTEYNPNGHFLRSNYESAYELSIWYWTSSHYDINNVWAISIVDWVIMFSNDTGGQFFVRLSITF